MKNIRAHVIISDNVQNVGFRFNTRIKARNLGLTGWIKNLPDGDVESVFEGEEDKVKGIIEWFKKGPFLSKINDVKVEFNEYKAEFESFEIR